MAAFSRLGNDLYTGERSVDFVGRRRVWFSIAVVLMVLSVLLPILRGGFNLGIEFTGGSDFRVTVPADRGTPQTDPGEQAVTGVLGGDASPKVQVVGTDAVRVQVKADEGQTNAIRDALAKAYQVEPEHGVAVSFIDPSWGSDVTAQALRGLVVFVLLAMAMMALYFRTWRMALASILALLHVLVVSVGIYGAVGFEITPAAMIGFLTILAYSLYDTVVVFDKIRENTDHLFDQHERTFDELVNLAVNQTLIRSINTSVVAVLPVAAILFIGVYLLGAGTLRDISLALFVGILIGAYSTIFIASPLYVSLRRREPRIREHTAEVLRRRSGDGNGDRSDHEASVPAPAP